MYGLFGVGGVVGRGLGFGYVSCYGVVWVRGYCRFEGLGSKVVWGM